MSKRVAHWLLALYPPAFRKQFGEGMTAMYAQRVRDARASRGTLGRLLFYVRELWSLALGAIRERLRLVRRPVRGPGPIPRRSPPGLSERVGDVVRELWMTVRRLARSPAFTTVSILTMAVGIGATAAIFTVSKSVMFAPLPYPDPDRLVALWLDTSPIGYPESGLSPAGYIHFLTKNRSFEQMGVYGVLPFDTNLTGDDRPERVSLSLVSWGLLAALGVPPVLGRPIAEHDDVPDASPVAVLSHGLWVRRFGGDPNVLGSTIPLNGISVEVVGVMGPEFAFPSAETDIWVPLRISSATRDFGITLFAVARLKEDVTLGAALSDIERLIERLPEAGYPPSFFPGVYTGRGTVRTLKEQTVRFPQWLLRVESDIERSLVILLAAVGFVLLIACTNVANLFLVRSEGRQREVAVRAALGAGRGAIFRHVLAEAVTVSVTGGVLGLILAYGSIEALVALRPAALPRLDEIAIDQTVLWLTVAVSVFSGLLFGMFPALQQGATNLVAVLKDGGRSATGGRGRHRVRNVLVAVQVALALVLLVGSGLMVRSFGELHAVDPGFDPESVFTFELGLPGNDYPNVASVTAFYHQLLDRLESLPGVEHVGAVNSLPFTGLPTVGVWMEDFPVGPNDFPETFNPRRVALGYFTTMGIPLVEGRVFDRADHEQRLNTVLISQNMAERLWPGESPIGRRIRPGPNASWEQIVGVVGSVRDALTEDSAETIYLPMTARGWYGSRRNMVMTIKSSLDPTSLVGPVRREVRSLDPNLPISNVRTMDSVVGESVSRVSFTMLLLGIAAGVALFLGAVGIYGVIAYSVSQRTGEIGIRMALGARAAEVSRMIVRQGGTVVLVGLAIGLIGALALTRVMEVFLFNVSPTDPATYAGVTMLLLAIGLLAAYLPARRAAGVDPVQALRAD